MSKKPSAAERTVDMFTGSTATEAREQSDLHEEERGKAESTEVLADRLRDKAFQYQEYFSKRFSDKEPSKSKFRLTIKDDMLYLEQFRNGVDGMAYHYSGVMFHTDSLYEITSVLVKASKDKHGSGTAS